MSIGTPAVIVDEAKIFATGMGAAWWADYSHRMKDRLVLLGASFRRHLGRAPQRPVDGS